MLNPEVFRQAIHAGGEQVRWLKAIPHTCYDPATNYDQQRGCEECSFGMVYEEEVLPSNVRALITNLKQKWMDAQMGLVKEGDLVCQTMPDEIWLSPLDRLVLVQREQIKWERLTKGVDQLSEPYPVSLAEVTDGTHYAIGTDCQLDAATAKVEWIDGGDAPETGAVYAVQYRFNPVFWYIYGDQTPPRPATLVAGGVTPQKGFLVQKHPGEA
jgi:hypothetical protein